MKLIERNDAAMPWFNPMKPRIMRALGHGKHANRIGAQHQFGSDAVGRKRPAAHGALRLWRSIHTARIQEMLEPMDVIEAVLNISIAHKRAEQWQSCFNAINDKFIKRTTKTH